LFVDLEGGGMVVDSEASSKLSVDALAARDEAELDAVKGLEVRGVAKADT
jgi:hypothetical protein